MRLHSTLALALGLCLPGLAHADVQRFTGDGFVITATTADQPVAGATTDVQLAITPTSGYQVNEEFPTAIEITAPADVAVAKTKLGKGDGTVRHARADFRLTLTPKTTGDKLLGLKLKFALCTDSTCEPRKHSAELRLHVK